MFDAIAAVGAASASQNSTLTSTSMSGSNHVSAGTAGGVEGSTAISLFLVGFRLDTASAFNLWANVGLIHDTLGVHLELRTAAGVSIYSQYLDEFYPFDGRGVLPAGDYVLEIEGSVMGLSGITDWGDWNFDFTLVSCGDGLIVGTERCDDGINNDPLQDSLIDLDDPDCHDPSDAYEACGLGFELVLVLMPPLMWLRGRRGRAGG